MNTPMNAVTNPVKVTGIRGRRTLVLLAAMLALFPAAVFAIGPGDSPPEILRVDLVPVTRALAGRTSEALIVGTMRYALMARVAGVSLEGGEVVVRLAGPALTSVGGDYDFGFRIELPPLPEGQYRLKVVSQTSQGAPLDDYTVSYTVHSPLAVSLVPDASSPGSVKAQVSGRATFARFPTPLVKVEGDRIEIQFFLGCDVACGEDEVASFDLLSPPFTPPPGVEKLEIRLVDDYVRYHQPRILFEGRLDRPHSSALVQGGRFEIALALDPPHGEEPRLVRPASEDSALFYFFSPDNWEAMVKVLDGCSINGHFWVYAAASTDVGYTLRVDDRFRRTRREYRHEAGSPAPALTDNLAFRCE